MSDLTATEKEQVAALLGCDWMCTRCEFFGKPHKVGGNTHYHNPSCTYEAAPVVTLEACMEYAKGKGWGWMLSSFTDNQSEYEASFYGWFKRLGSASASDPLTAFVRALLKAEAAS